MSFRFVVASHQHLFRDLLREHLVQKCGAKSVAEFATTQQLKRDVALLRSADLLFVDGDMADGSPLPAIRIILARRLVNKVVLMTDMPGAYLAEAAMRLGLRGVIHKRDSLDNFESAVTTIASGGLYISPHIDLAGRIHFSRILSDRELDVFRLQASGLSLARVARQLKLKPLTVQTHRKNYMRKLAITTQLGLTLFAIGSGLIPFDCVQSDEPRIRR